MDTITEDTPLSNEGSFPGEQQNYLTTFRVAGNTSITQFKEMACKFWVSLKIIIPFNSLPKIE